MVSGAAQVPEIRFNVKERVIGTMTKRCSVSIFFSRLMEAARA